MTEWVSTRLKGPRTLGTTPPTLRLTPAARRAQVKWVYPGPDNHDPERYFQKDATIYWYEFKSTSRKRELMSQPKFCGHEPGPRTHFVIEATRAYSIVAFSSFGEEEAEVLAFGRPSIAPPCGMQAPTTARPVPAGALSAAGRAVHHRCRAQHHRPQ